MYNIIRANLDDYMNICELDYAVINSSCREEYIKDCIEKGTCYIVKIDNNIAGFAVLERNLFNNDFISLVIIHPKFRKRGGATALIKYLESKVSKGKLFSSANKSNEIMRYIFNSLGFKESGYIENLDKNDPEIIYYKEIRGNGNE